MKKISFALLVFSFVLFTFSLFVLIFTNQPIGAQTFYSSVNVTEDSIGFDISGNNVSFGKVSLGGSSSRTISLVNDYGFPIKLDINSEGSIQQFLTFEDEMIVNEGEAKKLSFGVFIPPEAETGFYDGNIIIKIKRSF